MSNQKSRTLKVIEKTKVTFPVLLDNKSVGRNIYKIRGTPTTFMIDKEGNVVFRHIGYYPGMETVLMKEVRNLTAGPAQAAASSCRPVRR